VAEFAAAGAQILGNDDAAARATAERVFDRSRDIAASATNPFLVPAGAPWRERLAQIAAPLRHSRP
jgi:hypothetical protein